MKDEIQLKDLSDQVQASILECAANNGVKIDEVMWWINSAKALYEEVAGE